MTETAQYEDKIVYVATAFRTDFSKKEKFTPTTAQKTDGKEINLRKQGCWSECPSFRDEEDSLEDVELSKKFYGANIEEWNKAFPKLRPPPIITKRRNQSGVKFASKSCKEILQIVRSYEENLENEKERVMDMGITNDTNQSVHYLWHTESTELEEDSDSEDSMELAISNRGITETPIPRNLTRF